MLVQLLTPMMIASSPLMLMPPPPSTYSHATQTTVSDKLAASTQTTVSYATTMPTMHTNTCNQADGCPNGHDTDLGGSDSTVGDFN